MGMFDTVRSSYPIFGCPWDHDLQTKSLDCIMAEYWISPSGQLYEVDYSGTHDWVEKAVEDRKGPFDRFTTIPNGQHGRVRATRYWGHMHVTADREKDWERTIVFEDGILVAGVGGDTTISRRQSPLVSWFSR